MAFKKKTWVDRMVEYAGRRKITNATTMAAQIVDVERAEGVVSEEGTAINAANMNDLEQRTADAFSGVEQEIEGINSDLDGNRFGHTADGRPGWKDGADTVHPFNNLAAYHLTHSWDNLSQGPNNMYTITINLPACKDALLFLSARVNGISADAWTRTLNSGDLSAVEIGRKGAGLKVNVATTMICLLVTSNNGCNVTFTTNDNDYQSVKIAMLLEP